MYNVPHLQITPCRKLLRWEGYSSHKLKREWLQNICKQSLKEKHNMDTNATRIPKRGEEWKNVFTCEIRALEEKNRKETRAAEEIIGKGTNSLAEGATKHCPNNKFPEIRMNQIKANNSMIQ